MIASDPKVEVWRFCAEGGNRAFCDRMNGWAQHEGQPGLGYISGARRGKWRRAARQEHRAERTKQIADQLASASATRCSSSPGKTGRVVKFAVRTHQGRRGAWAHCQGPLRLLLDRRLPMFEWNEEDKKSTSRTTRSRANMDIDEFLKLDPAADQDKLLGIKAIQYDIVCNGVELSSGAIRNHRPDVMKKAFAIAGYPEDVLEAKFGGMLRAAVARCAAARRHRAGHRPHRHAALRRGEPARGGAVPD